MDDCERSYELSSNQIVDVSGSVCFHCPAQVPVLEWLISGQRVNSSTGAAFSDRYLAVFLAGEAFSLRLATLLSCVTQSATNAFYITLKGRRRAFV